MANRRYPMFSACGLNCGLCPRYYTDGSSRCPGCGGEGFSKKHPPCGVLSCSQRCGIEYCYQCDVYPCKKYDGADLSDSFITHRNQFTDIDKAKAFGLEAYEAELSSKMVILEHLVKNHDDGRRKSFFCIAVNLLPLEDIRSAMQQIADETTKADSTKVKAAAATRIFEAMAKNRGISLQLRKKAV